MSRLFPLRAWSLTEGSTLSDGAEVLSLHRNPVTYHINVLTSRGDRWTFPGDYLVLVVQRSAAPNVFRWLGRG